MKKAIALLAAVGCCGIAHAQSSITISGTADSYLTHATGNRTSSYGLGSGGDSTSKLRIRGSEDLGGGMRAGFWLESGILLDTGAGQPTNTNNQPSGATPTNGSMTWNRRSMLFFSAPWGEIRGGRDWSPTYETYAGRFNPFAVGNGIGINYNGGINPNFVRVSNDVSYLTPKFAGLYGHIHHWFSENARGTPTADDGSGDGVRLMYENGPLNGAAVLVRSKFAAGNAILRSASLLYDFKLVRVTATVNRDNQANVRQAGEQIGFWLPLGIHEVKGTISQIRSFGRATADARKYAAGYTYNFSKRTAFYAIHTRVYNNNASTLVLPGSTTTPGGQSTALDLGIRTLF